ncbi:MAG: hypothetical protein QMB65_08500, partial [Vicingaceae bacterium]
SNVECNSYRETVNVLSENNSPYVFQMKVACIRCYFKKTSKKIIYTLANIFGFKNVLNKRLEKKWS